MIGPDQYEAGTEFILSERQAEKGVSPDNLNDGYVEFMEEIFGHPSEPAKPEKPEEKESREVISNIIDGIEIVMA